MRNASELTMLSFFLECHLLGGGKYLYFSWYKKCFKSKNTTLWVPREKARSHRNPEGMSEFLFSLLCHRALGTALGWATL